MVYFVSNRAAAVGIFAQARPTADRLTERSRAGALPPFWDRHVGELAQRALHNQANFLGAEQIGSHLQEIARVRAKPRVS